MKATQSLIQHHLEGTPSLNLYSETVAVVPESGEIVSWLKELSV